MQEFLSFLGCAIVKRLMICFFLIASALSLRAQITASASQEMPTTVVGWSDRLARFGKGLPQEKVFLHLDNNCYFLGDTIYFKAYLTRTDTRRASHLSRVLYVELLNQDGYLVERQLIEMTRGQGHGAVALADTMLYGGFYELRAYTRWMLNWGEYEHPHTSYAEDWFFNKQMAKEYYRDWDKIYSRVFPVYDRPLSPGDYAHDMTLRPLTRYFKAEEKSVKATLVLFPEGGDLPAGVPARVAFEANDSEGRHLEGTVVVTDGSGQEVTRADVEHRGRGSFTLTAKAGEHYHATLTSGTLTAKVQLPEAVEKGCVLRPELTESALQVHVSPVGMAAGEELALTVMNNGILHYFAPLSSSTTPSTLSIPLESLATGVNQLTVYNAEGRVYADRLCFVNRGDCEGGTLDFAGVEDSYEPFAPIALRVQRRNAVPGGTISLAVRDAVTSDQIYDDGSLLTEMLLASDIKGFVEQPGYYFEADDEAHRRHLDLLLMVQGWRRFDWQTMATPGAFALNHYYEQTQRLQGSVQNYTAVETENELRDAVDAKHNAWVNPEEEDEEKEKSPSEQTYDDMNERLKNATGRTRKETPTSRFHKKESNLKREVTVHAEFVQEGSSPLVGDMMTEKGHFTIDAPKFYDYCTFHLAATDTTKRHYRSPKWTWVQANPENIYEEPFYPDYYVKLDFCYPNFVKPYGYYQQHLPPLRRNSPLAQAITLGERTLSTIYVGASRGGKRSFQYSKPAFRLDAYEAFNRTCDVGLCAGYFIGAERFVADVTRAYLGDMGVDRSYNVEVRRDGENASTNRSPAHKQKYNKLDNLGSVVIYTDFCPRQEGSARYEGANQPEVIIDLRLMPDDGQRYTFRDRFYQLPGFAVCEDFYHPSYATKPLPDTKDYRRTLYWNPSLPLDAQGGADVRFYNNGKRTQIEVTAEGFGPQSEILTGRK